MTITLPSVSEAKGRVFTFWLKTDGGNVTLQDQDESLLWGGDYSFTAADDHLSLMSDGIHWILLETDLT